MIIYFIYNVAGWIESYQHGNLCRQLRKCLTLVRGHQTCQMGPEEYHVCPHAQSTTGKIQLLHTNNPPPGFRLSKVCSASHIYLFHQFLQPKQNTVCRTFTRLLSRAQAVSCCAHAGSGGRGGGETQLGTVSIVNTAEISAWEHKSTGTNAQNKS